MATENLVRVAQRLLPKSASRSTMETAKNNKTGLSAMLDATMKEGVHDVRAFGLGFLRSCASREEYEHFTRQYYHIYSAMEEEFDATPGPFRGLWSEATSSQLRRAPSLLQDLEVVADGGAGGSVVGEPSSATADYLQAIRAAACRDDGVRLFGHFWCRYFADLYGGRALGLPTQLAMGLPAKPHFYASFPPSVTDDRHAYIDRLYGLINEHGNGLGDEAAEAIVEEGRVAFRHNAAVYTARPGLPLAAAKGGLQIARGAVGHFLSASASASAGAGGGHGGGGRSDQQG